ncbi:MAG: IclR family transcriptional regulator [Nitrolancea sp.]
MSCQAEYPIQPASDADSTPSTVDPPSLRALVILEALADHPIGLTLTEVSDHTKITKTTAYRFLQDLVRHHYIRRDDPSKRYFLGTRVLGLSMALLDELDVRQLARPHLEKLVDELQETVHLVQLDGTEAVYIDKVDCPQPIMLKSRVGKRRPIHCTGVGKVLLAFAPEPLLEQIIRSPGLTRHTPTTITDPDELRQEVMRIRARGYALDNSEHREGITCVAGPVFDVHGEIAASVSVAGPTFRFPLTMAETCAPRLLESCRAISLSCGFQGWAYG